LDNQQWRQWHAPASYRLPFDQIPIRGYRQHRRHHPWATRWPSRTPL